MTFKSGVVWGVLITVGLSMVAAGLIHIKSSGLNITGLLFIGAGAAAFNFGLRQTLRTIGSMRKLKSEGSLEIKRK